MLICMFCYHPLCRLRGSYRHYGRKDAKSRKRLSSRCLEPGCQCRDPRPLVIEV